MATESNRKYVRMTEKRFDTIIDILQTSSTSINQITSDESFPSRDCFYRYLHKKGNEHQFQRYVKARKAQVVVCCDEMLEIADETGDDILTNSLGDAGNMTAVRRAEIRINTRIRLAQLLRSKMYNPEDSYISVKAKNDREAMNIVVDRFKNSELSAEEARQALSVFEKSIDSQHKHEIAEFIENEKLKEKEKMS